MIFVNRSPRPSRPGLTHALAGLWWDVKGAWNRAHESAQNDGAGNWMSLRHRLCTSPRLPRRHEPSPQQSRHPRGELGSWTTCSRRRLRRGALSGKLRRTRDVYFDKRLAANRNNSQQHRGRRGEDQRNAERSWNFQVYTASLECEGQRDAIVQHRGQCGFGRGRLVHVFRLVRRRNSNNMHSRLHILPTYFLKAADKWPIPDQLLEPVVSRRGASSLYDCGWGGGGI